MKRWFFLIIIMLIFFANRSGIKKEESKAQPLKKLPEQVKPVSDYVPKKFPPVHEKVRKPAASGTFDKNKIKRSFSSLPPSSGTKVGKSFEVVADVSTVLKSDYKPEMGTIVSRDKNYIFFHPASQNQLSYPVAMNASTRRLYPISPVLHVKGADQAVRDQLKAQGMKEFYFNERMKMLSVEVSPSTILSHYQALLKQGLDVRMEVLKDPPRSR